MTDIKKTKPQDLPFVLVLDEESQVQVEQQDTPPEFRICPDCQIGHLDEQLSKPGMYLMQVHPGGCLT